MKFGVLMLCLLAAGCSLKRSPPGPVTPPAPRPVAKPVAAAAPPPEPLSIPQTDVRLPAPQPIPPEALPTVQEPPPAAAPMPEPSSPKPVRKAAGPPLPPPAPKTEAEPAEQRIQTLISPAEQRRLSRNIDARRRETEGILTRIRGSSPDTEQRAAIDRVVSFLNLSAQAAQRGDLRQADALSVLALSLAKDLVDGR
jgi:hypothetical protein